MVMHISRCENYHEVKVISLSSNLVKVSMQETLYLQASKEPNLTRAIQTLIGYKTGCLENHLKLI